MHVLYYWQPDNYRRDRRFQFGFHLNQNSPVLARINKDESVWAFTRNEVGHYVLAAELIVRAVVRNPPRYRYGSRRAWGDLHRSRYFETEGAPSIEQIIRSLSPSTNAVILAQSFQGHRAVKPLTQEDHQVLALFACELPVVDTGAIFPEDQLEARLLLGSDALNVLIPETEARYVARTKYLYESFDVTRSRRYVEWLQNKYNGRCQICLFDPRQKYGRRLCHGHHIRWLSRGGEDELDNIALVCPTHHAAIHADDAVFDYSSLAFMFSNGLVEEIAFNDHLPVAT
jgi:5-methylcytosine-specific restriction enzyme A